jgi:hypothetical protein
MAYYSRPSRNIDVHKTRTQHFGEKLDAEAGGVTDYHYFDPEETATPNRQRLESNTHTERKRVFMHRSSKDKYMTLNPSVHTVNTRHPSVYDRVRPVEYSRLCNSLQVRHGGEARFHGKRKAVKEDIHINHNSSSALGAEVPHPITVNNNRTELESFPNFVEQGDPARTM